MSPFEFLKTIEKCLSLVSQLLLGCFTSECIYAPIAQVPNAQETPTGFIYEHTVAFDDTGQLARRQFANLGNIPGAPVFVADCREVFPRPVPAELEAEGEGMGILREKGQDKEDRTEEEGDAGEGVGEVFEHFWRSKGRVVLTRVEREGERERERASNCWESSEGGRAWAAGIIIL